MSFWVFIIHLQAAILLLSQLGCSLRRFALRINRILQPADNDNSCPWGFRPTPPTPPISCAISQTVSWSVGTLTPGSRPCDAVRLRKSPAED